VTPKGQICNAPSSVLSSIRNFPRIALHRPDTDLGYGLPSLEAHATQPTVVCHLNKIINTPAYRGHMADTHMHKPPTPFQTSPSTRCVPNGQVGLRPSTKANRHRLLTVCGAYPNLRHVAFYSLVFQMHHPCIGRKLPCYMYHTPAHKISRIEHGIHSSKPLQQVPKMTSMWNTE
jgi:hypothetical protein